MPKPTHLPHLHRDRHGTYYFRLTILGKTVKRSLGTKSASLATIWVSRLNWLLDMQRRRNDDGTPVHPKEANSTGISADDVLEAMFKEAMLKEATPHNLNRVMINLPNGVQFAAEDINTLADRQGVIELMRSAANLTPDPLEAIGPIEGGWPPQPAAYVPQPTSATLVSFPQWEISQAEYLKEVNKSDINSIKTVREKESVYNEFLRYAKNSPHGAITQQTAQDYQASLVTNDAIGVGRTNKKIGYLSSLFDWMQARNRVSLNPFAALRIGTKQQRLKSIKPFEPFTSDELRQIFSPHVYRGYASKDHFKWLPFLLMFTGARPDEIASLNVTDVMTDNESGVHYFDIKKSKNIVSARRIPLHKCIVESGFLAYVDKVRSASRSNGQLFPLLKEGPNGHIKNVSRRFNENLLPAVGIVHERKKLNSMRHTFITRMTELNTNTAMLMALVGHYEQAALDLSAPHFNNYQGIKSLVALKKVIDNFDRSIPMDCFKD